MKKDKLLKRIRREVRDPEVVGRLDGCGVEDGDQTGGSIQPVERDILGGDVPVSREAEVCGRVDIFHKHISLAR